MVEQRVAERALAQWNFSFEKMKEKFDFGEDLVSSWLASVHECRNSGGEVHAIPPPIDIRRPLMPAEIIEFQKQLAYEEEWRDRNKLCLDNILRGRPVLGLLKDKPELLSVRDGPLETLKKLKSTTAKSKSLAIRGYSEEDKIWPAEPGATLAKPDAHDRIWSNLDEGNAGHIGIFEHANFYLSRIEAREAFAQNYRRLLNNNVGRSRWTKEQWDKLKAMAVPTYHFFRAVTKGMGTRAAGWWERI